MLFDLVHLDIFGVFPQLFIVMPVVLVGLGFDFFLHGLSDLMLVEIGQAPRLASHLGGQLPDILVFLGDPLRDHCRIPEDLHAQLDFILELVQFDLERLVFSGQPPTHVIFGACLSVSFDDHIEAHGQHRTRLLPDGIHHVRMCHYPCFHRIFITLVWLGRAGVDYGTDILVGNSVDLVGFDADGAKVRFVDARNHTVDVSRCPIFFVVFSHAVRFSSQMLFRNYSGCRV